MAGDVWGEHVPDDGTDVFDGGVVIGEGGDVVIEVFVVEGLDDVLVNGGVELGDVQ